MPGDGVTTPSLLALAVAARREAGRAGRARCASAASRSPATKSSPVDVVTEADRACEELIRDRLLGARPDDGFLGEEGDDVASRPSGVTWIVDPIDGTVNYLYGIPHYAVSIAARAVDECPVAGVVRQRRPRRAGVHRRRGAAAPPGRRTALEVRPTRRRSTQALVGTGFDYEADVTAPAGRGGGPAAPAGPRHPPAWARPPSTCARSPAGRLDAYVEEGLHLVGHARPAAWSPPRPGAASRMHPGVGGQGPCVVSAPAHGFDEFRDLVVRAGFLGPGACGDRSREPDPLRPCAGTGAASVQSRRCEPATPSGTAVHSGVRWCTIRLARTRQEPPARRATHLGEPWGQEKDMATDYDAPRKTEEDQNEESLEELKARRHDKNSGKVDEDEAEAAESFELPGRRPLARGARGRGPAAAGRRVHLHELLPGAPPQPARGREEADLQGLRLSAGARRRKAGTPTGSRPQSSRSRQTADVLEVRGEVPGRAP